MKKNYGIHISIGAFKNEVILISFSGSKANE